MILRSYFPFCISVVYISHTLGFGLRQSPIITKSALVVRSPLKRSFGTLSEQRDRNLQVEASTAQCGRLRMSIDNFQPTAVPELDAWKILQSGGVIDFFSPNSTAPLGQEIGTADVVDIGMTDLFETLSNEDNDNVSEYWRQLRPELEHLTPPARKKALLALKVAYVAHNGQLRKSGEPFIIHPVAVAKILASMNMDCETVVSGLLHDTVEDTNLTFTQVETFFGRQVRTIVEGETKVSKLPKIALSNFADEQAENLRQMFIAMTEDYRIIIVKLADRLHNMRTLKYMSKEKQIKISRETLDIFAPLAHRLGLWTVKSELEDISFRYLYPSEYANLNRRIRKRYPRYQRALSNSKAALELKLAEDKMLNEQAVNVTVVGRMKELYSLWVKMETKYERKLDKIQDAVAIRVILDLDRRPNESVEEWKTRGVWLCYHTLGLVQHLPGCQPVPSQVKDYISFPKPNGYQSLHTTIMREGQVVEVQIRTMWMHSVAEYGLSSHWLYKEQQTLSGGARASGSSPKPYRIPWLNCITEWQHEIKSSREFVEVIRRELLGQRVFVFLRDGRILNLSRGSTVVDVAFQIHTEIGLNMVGAIINGQPAPFNYELSNGDVVSIVTAALAAGEDPRPQPEWLRYAKTRQARAKLRTHFRTRQRGNLVDAGHLVLDDFIRKHKTLLIEELGTVPDMAFMDKAVHNRIGPSLDDFCVQLASSEEEEVLGLMSKALHISGDKFDSYGGPAHDFWQPKRRRGVRKSGNSTTAGINGFSAGTHHHDHDELDDDVDCDEEDSADGFFSERSSANSSSAGRSLSGSILSDTHIKGRTDVSEKMSPAQTQQPRVNGFKVNGSPPNGASLTNGFPYPFFPQPNGKDMTQNTPGSNKPTQGRQPRKLPMTVPSETIVENSRKGASARGGVAGYANIIEGPTELLPLEPNTHPNMNVDAGQGVEVSGIGFGAGVGFTDSQKSKKSRRQQQNRANSTKNNGVKGFARTSTPNTKTNSKAFSAKNLPSPAAIFSNLPPPPNLQLGDIPTSSMPSLSKPLADNVVNVNSVPEYEPEPPSLADPQMLCPHCCPVRGDTIMGVAEEAGDVITVHRKGCAEAEKQLQQLKRMQGRRWKAAGLSSTPLPPFSGRKRLVWSPVEEEGVLYSCGISVYCTDRKYLLSDVSEAVSKDSIIASTASKTHGRDATLQFQIMVRSVEHLQQLIDTVMKIDSVMTCDRIYGA